MFTFKARNTHINAVITRSPLPFRVTLALALSLVTLAVTYFLLDLNAEWFFKGRGPGAGSAPGGPWAAFGLCHGAVVWLGLGWAAMLQVDWR